ncbi:hypothetical protein [Nonomuraea insulae]|uniref:Uncharacterized protein n=1 Tax=Nonomuraea insulae TaxID=1616787 RepID=A0ABW1CDS5_9ACTN
MIGIPARVTPAAFVATAATPEQTGRLLGLVVDALLPRADRKD